MSKNVKKTFDFSIENLLRSDYTDGKSFNKNRLNNYREFSNGLSICVGDIEEESQNISLQVQIQPNEEDEIDVNNKNSTTTILSEAESYEKSNGGSGDEKMENHETFSWLNCTRFKPPKLPRSRKRGTLAKRLGRGPRIPFTPHQIAVLENTFSNAQYWSSECINGLANALHLSETRVKIWAQNRRARYRREKDTGQYENEINKSESNFVDPISSIRKQQRSRLMSSSGGSTHLLTFQSLKLPKLQDDQMSMSMASTLEREQRTFNTKIPKSPPPPPPTQFFSDFPFHRISHSHSHNNNRIHESLTFADLAYLNNNNITHFSNSVSPPMMVSVSKGTTLSTTSSMMPNYSILPS